LPALPGNVSRVSQPAGQPPYYIGYLRELVTSAIKLYEIHPMAGHPVTEATGAAMLTHTALLQQLVDGIDARYDRDNPDALKNAWIISCPRFLGLFTAHWKWLRNAEGSRSRTRGKRSRRASLWTTRLVTRRPSTSAS
jgi:hypothetical protein